MEENRCLTCKGRSEKGSCPYCRRRLKKILQELISFIDLLNSSPSLRQQVSSNQEGRGSLSSSLIINVQIVDLISKNGVQLVLESWAKMIIEERNLNIASISSTKERSKLHAIHLLLDTHNDWLADTDLWLDYYNEVKEPWTTLRRIIYGERKPPKAVLCPVAECKGSLRLEHNADVHCTTDKTHQWPYENWSRLALLLVEPNVQS
jgi:hypothetical protein